MLNKAAENIIKQAERYGKDVIIAIDGRCASGKSTLADIISGKTDCNIIHTDDFFLRPEQRTEERFSEAGGNVDYERFFSEVIVPLTQKGECEYRPFDCRTMTLADPIKTGRKSITIIEGTYSCHPYLGRYYDLCVFLKTSEKEQAKRLKKRNAALYERFEREWIPMEEKYFNSFGVEEKCDILIET